MSVDPKRVAIQAALRCLQLRGTDQATLQASYLDGTIGTIAGIASALDGADIPVGALADAVLAVESELVEVIANDRTHPYRSLFYGRSDDLPNATEIPAESDELIRFIGVFSGICDSVDDMPLVEGTVQEINRHIRGSYLSEVRKFKISAGKVYHTRANIYFEGCVWSRSIAKDKFLEGPTGVSQLPDSLEGVWVARTIEFLVQEGWLTAEGAFYANFAQQGIQRLRARNFDLPQLPSDDSMPKLLGR